MFEAFVDGLVLVFQWPAIGFLFLGVLIGIWLGAVPGLTETVGSERLKQAVCLAQQPRPQLLGGGP